MNLAAAMKLHDKYVGSVLISRFVRHLNITIFGLSIDGTDYWTVNMLPGKD
jgi:hypothetical protein